MEMMFLNEELMWLLLLALQYLEAERIVVDCVFYHALLWVMIDVRMGMKVTNVVMTMMTHYHLTYHEHPCAAYFHW